LQANIAQYKQDRKQIEPSQRHAGSVFKDPPGAEASHLIDQVGLKGKTIGRAQIWERNANYIVNKGEAVASDIAALIMQAHQTVFERFGVSLELDVELHDGAALQGFVAGALAQAHGPFPAVQGWYASFLQSFVLPNVVPFSYVVTCGEILVGLGLIFGVLTGIAAFFGVFMNLNFMLAGAVSINPIIGTLAILIVLAWRVAGYYGIDSVLLPVLGTPWTGSLTKTGAAHTTA
jgi:uncharacterized membrane protein YphA (DoxX/SURF4 family)